MEKLINKLILLGSVLGMAFGAYTFLMERPSSLISDQKKDLESQIEKVETSIRTEMRDRREARDREMSDIKAQIAGAEGRVMQKLEIIDSRLYELQKRTPSSRSASIQPEDDDGG